MCNEITKNKKLPMTQDANICASASSTPHPFSGSLQPLPLEDTAQSLHNYNARCSCATIGTPLPASGSCKTSAELNENPPSSSSGFLFSGSSDGSRDSHRCRDRGSSQVGVASTVSRSSALEASQPTTSRWRLGDIICLHSTITRCHRVMVPS